MTLGRSLGATLALAFGATTFAAFALVGTYVYTGLERQVCTQDDLDIVLEPARPQTAPTALPTG